MGWLQISWCWSCTVFHCCLIFYGSCIFATRTRRPKTRTVNFHLTGLLHICTGTCPELCSSSPLGWRKGGTFSHLALWVDSLCKVVCARPPFLPAQLKFQPKVVSMILLALVWKCTWRERTPATCPATAWLHQTRRCYTADNGIDPEARKSMSLLLRSPCYWT